jgi:4-amino-4-deoxychorismate lyase
MKYFETIRCEDEEVFNLWYHKQRIAKTIGINVNLEDYIYPPTQELLKCKFIYDSNLNFEIVYDKYTPKDITTLKIITDDSIEYKFKALNREDIDKLYMRKDEADEIVIVKNGFITDTSIANIAVLIDNIWFTPKHPLLYGTTRARLLDDKILEQKDITVEELLNSKKIALMNAMIGFKELEYYDIIT